jgi:hypothetical protein
MVMVRIVELNTKLINGLRNSRKVRYSDSDIFDCGAMTLSRTRSTCQGT